ncbi:MAG TPA: hypothetical protein VGY30_08840 [Solirubrobacteraceae bacterium]|jgi:hypothetical protein|nr:hypothetical protein [Solirubrobacteraceae bacterium]
MKHSRTIAVGAFAAAALSLAVLSPVALAASGGHKAGKGTPANVRVEGISKTLLAETTVLVKAASIDKDGKAADVCEGATGAAALQDATKGNWTAGTFSAGLGYPVVGIFGESYPFTSAYYWSFWIDDKPATTGICGAMLHAKEKLLFFPQCSQESASACPQGMFDPPVLQIKDPARPSHVRVGHPLNLSVFSLANFTGKSTPAAGAKVSGGGHSATTSAAGKAKLKFAKPGTYKVVATATESVRDELTVKVTR